MNKVTKTGVNDFIGMVRRKAILAIDEKFSALKQAEKEQLAADTEVQAAALQVETAYTVLGDMLKALEKTVRGKKWEANNQCSYYSDRIWRLEGDLRPLTSGELGGKEAMSTFKRLLAYYSPVSAKLTKISEQHTEALAEVRTAYNAVEQGVNAISSAKKKIEYLKELGFDVAWFDKPVVEQHASTVEVDTAKLFPCGSRS